MWGEYGVDDRDAEVPIGDMRSCCASFCDARRIEPRVLVAARQKALAKGTDSPYQAQN